MKRILWCLLLLPSIAWSQTLVQHKVNSTAASVASLALTVTSTGSGHVYIAGGLCTSTGATVTITDNQSTTYTADTNAATTNTGWGSHENFFYALTPASGVTTVTVHCSVSGNAAVWFTEWSPPASTTAAYDTSCGVSNQASATGCTVNITGSKDAIVGYMVNGSAAITANPTAGNEFTTGGDLDPAFGFWGWVSLSTTTTGNHNPAWTASGTNHSVATFAIKFTSAGGATVVPRHRGWIVQ